MGSVWAEEQVNVWDTVYTQVFGQGLWMGCGGWEDGYMGMSVAS